MSPAYVRAVLERYPPEERPSASPTPLAGTGGLSGSSLWRYAAAAGERALRAWPASTPGLERVQRVHGWLLATTGLAFVARPIFTMGGSTVVEGAGRCWDLSPWMPGESAAASSPTSARVMAVFTALAKLHERLEEVCSTHGASPGLSARRGELENLLGGGFDALAARIASRPNDPFASQATTWLGRAREAAPAILAESAAVAEASVRLIPCLRDARPEHFLLSGDEVTGLIDFGAMDVECVGADVGRLMGEWLSPDEAGSLRAEGLAAYRRVHGLADVELEAATAFERLGDVLIGERWGRWRFVEDRAFDEAAYEGGFSRGLMRVRRLASSSRFRP